MGKMMVNGMNQGHAAVSDWGLSHFPVAPVAPSMITDFGCGGGRNTAELLKRFPIATVTAMDYSQVSCDKTKQFNRGKGHCIVVPHALYHLIAHLMEGQLLHLNIIAQIVLQHHRRQAVHAVVGRIILTADWFYQKDQHVLHPSVETICGWYNAAREQNGNFLLNLGPDIRGRIPEYHLEFLYGASKRLNLERN